ncbi:hypothetical protein [Spiroplasma endosymbiont of Stenodema calcarata]|uniref:hypothetical protein n=1 Tax=Spiroplasma endosymbiont of Stenodema calcarata TaxID=3139328 RepID=UPI003CCB35DC
MKKLLSILGVATLTLTSAFSLAACSKGKKGVNDDYFDSEINKIDPTIRNQVKYTSTIAKILIASRHENMNTYGFPTLQYFLNNVGKNLNGTFKTKSGKEVKIKDYVEQYKQLNNIFYNPWKAQQKDYNPEGNNYNLMSSLVAMTNFSKWNTAENQGHPDKGKDPTTNRYPDFEVNENLGWAQYDTGALANTLSQKSDSVKAYIQKTKGWSDYYDSSLGPYASNILFHNSLSSPPTTSELSYKDGGNETKFGKAVANQASSLYDLFGLKYFNEAITALGQFGPGLELPVSASLSQLLPFVQNNVNGEQTSGIFLAAPFAILNSIKSKLFDTGTGKVAENSPLLKVFDRDTIDNTVLKVQAVSAGEPGTPDPTIKDMNLYDILSSSVMSEAMKVITNKQDQFLDLIHKDHTNAFLKWYSVLGNWFKVALAKEGSKFDVQKFNTVMSETIRDGVEQLQKLIGLFAEDTVIALIRTLVQMLNSSGFDLFNLLKGVAGFADWFYTSDDEGHYNLNVQNVQKIDNVYNQGPNKAGYNKDLMIVDPKSEYAKFILDNYGFDESTSQYKPGSLFDMINIWSHGGNDTYPDHEAMHKFIAQILDSQNGYIGTLTNQINQAMANDWFDNIFLDRKWYITASGQGVDGTKLGSVITNGQITGVRYQLHYYGPKDASTKLNRHTKPIGYSDPASGNSPSYIQQEQDPSKRHNIAPEGQTWSDQDWLDYDGLGDSYLENSENIKYSYVVEFDNQARFLYNPGIKDDLTKNSYLLSDFAWYYNNNRYY